MPRTQRSTLFIFYLKTISLFLSQDHRRETMMYIWVEVTISANNWQFFCSPHQHPQRLEEEPAVLLPLRIQRNLHALALTT